MTKSTATVMYIQHIPLCLRIWREGVECEQREGSGDNIASCLHSPPGHALSRS